MGTTSEKLAYLNDTKAKIKTMINATGGVVDENTTFRDYSKTLNTQIIKTINGEIDLFSRYPHVTGNGTSITLNDTEKAKIKTELNATELTQNGTPTPDSPVDINVITGSNNVKVENKNLAYTGWAEDFVNRIANTDQAELLTYDNKNCLKFRNDAGRDEHDNKYIFKIDWKENTQYTFVFDLLSVSGYFNFSIDYTDGTNSYINGSQSANEWRNVIWVSDANKTIKYLRVRNINGSSYINLDTFMILEGTYTVETVPDYVEHQEQNYPITLSSKNLLDFSNITVGKLGTYGTASVEGHNIIFTANNQTVYGVEIDLKDLNLKPNTTYTVSNLYENTGSFGGSNGWRYYDGTSYTVLAQAKTYFNFTTGDGTTNKLYFYLGSPTTYTGTLTLYDIQLLEGTILQADVPNYAPYIANPLEYYKIGDYADQIFKNTTDSEFYDSTLLENEWYLKKNIGKIIFDGSEHNWNLTSTYNAYSFWIPNNQLTPKPLDSRYKKYCNLFQYSSLAFSEAPNPSLCENTSNYNMFIFKTNGDYGETVSDWVVWLSSHNIEVYYPLATPTYIHISEIDYPTLKIELDNLYNNAKSYEGQTNITQTNDGLPFNISTIALEYIEDKNIEYERKLQEKSVTISNNGTLDIVPDISYDALRKVSVTTNIPEPILQEKSITITENGTTSVTPDTGYDGLDSVEVTTNVSSGTVSVNEKDVNFYDYDGTVVNSYTKSEFLALNSLPENPTHDGLTSQGWNWSLSDAKDYVNEYGKLNIGQMYVTDDGSTRIYITLYEGRLSPYLGIGVNGTVNIDWGDGSSEQITRYNEEAIQFIQHNYATKGSYKIVLSGDKIGIKGHSSYGSQLLYNNSPSSNSPNKVYQNSIIKVELGNNVYLYEYAFYSCRNLKTISIPNTIQSMPQSCFHQCIQLKSMIIPNSISDMGSSSIPNVLSIISLPNTLTNIPSYMFNNSYLEKIYMPSRCVDVTSYMFNGCQNLKEVILNKNTTSLNSSCFSNCVSLPYLFLPNKINYISSSAFENCYSMAYYDFSSHTAVPSLSSTNAFRNIPSDCKIIVPDSLYDTWIAATNWSNYASYIIKESDWNA